jgi:hypothetical protein
MRNANKIIFGIGEKKRPRGIDVDWKIILKYVTMWTRFLLAQGESSGGLL